MNHLALPFIIKIDCTNEKIEIIQSSNHHLSYPSFHALQNSIYDQYIHETEKEDYFKSFNMTSLVQTLKNQSTFTLLFQNKKHTQSLFTLICQERNEIGNATSILMSIQDLTSPYTQDDETLSAIASIYWLIYSIDLKNDSYIEIHGESSLPEFIEKEGCATKMMDIALNYIVVKDHRKEMQEFFDLNTLSERMEDQQTIAKEYQTTDGHWHMGRFIVKNRNAQGQIENVFYAVNIIDDRKQSELNYQKTLQETFEQMEEKNIVLNALADDYEDVYLCDLFDDTLQIIKERDAHLSYEQNKMYRYSTRQRDFCENYVEEKDGKELLKTVSRENLLEYFKHNRKLSIQYKVKANKMGYSHMESVLIGVQFHNKFKVIMGSRKIDTIIQKQEEQKIKLQNALDKSKKYTEIIGTIATLYDTIFLENLKTKAYEMIASTDPIQSISGKFGNLDNIRESTLKATVIPEMIDEVRDFVNPETLPSRLQNKDYIGLEYEAPNNKWYRAYFIVKKRDMNKEAEEVLFVSYEITKEKQQEFNYQKQLIDTANEAKKANASKTDFLRRMSHDIRTPINGIRGMLYISNHNIGNIEKQKECNEKIGKATDNLLSLVNDVLDMNKLESGSFTLKHQPFSLKQILDEVHTIIETQAKEYGVQFIAQNTNQVEHDHFIGSPEYLKRIFTNFVSNAIKYNKEGGFVRVFGKELSFDGKIAWYEFVCEDNGIGMSEEFLKQAFEPFSQEEQSQVRTKYTGTGLGLSISKSLIELLGGTVELHSKLNVGTKVIFRLPLEIDLEMHEEKDPTDYSKIRFDNTKVLLVEDNELNAEIAAFLFQEHGIHVKWVENGKLAVDEIQMHPRLYDYVFMDIMMPVMNGLEAAKAMREEGCTIPIFAMTANAFADDIQRSMDAGMNEHLTKPLREKDIIKVLLKYQKTGSLH